MCTVPVSLARLAGRSTRGTGPGMGGDLQEQWGGKGRPAAGGTWGRTGEKTAGGNLGGEW
jgi:hypothetical protein